MARVVLVTGAPASGKTTVAAVLRERLALPVLAKDRIKETLFDSLGIEPTDGLSRRLGSASFALMIALMEEFVRVDAALIVENAFRRTDGERLRALLAGSAVLCVHCQAEPEILVDRLRRRADDGSRHPGHHLADIDARIASGAWDRPRIDGDLVLVPSDDFASDAYRRAVDLATERARALTGERPVPH